MIGAWNWDAARLASIACELLLPLLCCQAGSSSRSCGHVLPQLTAALCRRNVLHWASTACKETDRKITQTH